ncbi:hypothetical protein LAJ19_21275 (plasmid) [Deinococcus taeanensis]|uniref:hypothetical protein n=1 Tax=Deinococcus taeanensis TaxID=2737050 RepID=UPI001CDC841C|nr:hypothetical protein [Deinococcus taeanensis]UBV45324.1 hypothetical protein LAJ19_21275 [Deinococcus taeanensis]
MNAEHHETRVLPTWLYPAAFWLALPVLLLSLLLPGGERLGVWFMMAVPAVAAAVVVPLNWRRDRAVSVAALVALTGVVGVAVLKSALF